MTIVAMTLINKHSCLRDKYVQLNGVQSQVVSPVVSILCANAHESCL